MEISVERYHYPVGQGIFSAQIVKCENRQYVCVYDCGTITGREGKENIKKYVKDLYGKSGGIIDLLVISHLDMDHINGVRHLYDEGFSIKKIVLPYMTKWEQLLFILERVEKDPRINYPVASSNLFFHFILNSPYYMDAEGESRRDVEVSSESEVVFSNTEVTIESVPLGHLNHEFATWEFVHFSLYFDRGDVFESSVINTFKIKFGKKYSNFDEEILLEQNFLLGNFRDLKAIYQDVFKSIKETSGIKNLEALSCNRSSVILYSGFERESFKKAMGITSYVTSCPEIDIQCNWVASGFLCTCHLSASNSGIGSNHDDCCKSAKNCSDLEYHGVFKNKLYEDNIMYRSGEFPATGWLGTGDAELSDINNCWELRRKLGMWRMSHVREVTVPHHGAENGACPFFFSLFNSKREIICIIHSQISGQQNNRNKVIHGRYDHPRKKICKIIWDANNIEPVHVTEDSRTKYYSAIDIDIFCCGVHQGKRDQARRWLPRWLHRS